MDILEESRIMLELAISSLQRAGHYTEQFERTVAKIKQEQVKKLNIDDVSGIAEHHCSNQITEKELFYNHCLKCGEYLSED